MILRGVVENTFGGALCFRGYARIGDLARISSPNSSYQREVDLKRSKEILDFLKNSEFRFFSELTFSLNFKDNSAIPNIVSGIKSIFADGINFNFIQKDYTDYQNSDKFESPLLRRISLEFKNEETKYLRRIDGNHRLSAVDGIDFSNLKDAESLGYLVPFNIILQQDNTEAERSENAYFHLINSKSKRLTSEENLKSIFDTNLFNDTQVTILLGNNSLKARDLFNNIKSFMFLSLQHIIHNSFRSFALDCIELFENEDVNVETIQKSIQQIDTLYLEENLTESRNKNILLSFIYFKSVASNSLFLVFKNWIMNNQLFEIDEIKAKSIIEIFKHIHEKRVFKIFVAMPYWSHAEVTEYNTLFKEICAAVSKKMNAIVELIPIMRFLGKTKRIDSRLIEKIKECDVFIADISGCNKNVIFEVGFAEGLNKKMVLLKAEQDKASPPFDMDKLQYIPYNKATYYNSIKNIVVRNLPDILKEYNVQ